MKPLLVTLGDPDGLGPELACRVLGKGAPEAPVLIVGPEEPLARHAERLGLPAFWRRVASSEEAREGVSLLVPEELEEFCCDPGRARPEGGRAAGIALGRAARLMRAGAGRALVTCPLHKAMLMEAGFEFPGHTEFLAEAAGLMPDDVTMCLAGPRLRVGLVTTHPPLRGVPDLITEQRVLRSLTHLWEFTRRLGLDAPLAVCGLNPHAGEGGRIGREEIEVIGPAVHTARDRGIDALGPLPADTLFHRAARGDFSAVLAMYHDQGLGPLKLLHFGEAVNVTLGLPYVRTSPDHGTGHDVTGTGRADAGGFRAAMRLALDLTREAG
ncbi:4-hydroxythreonine-4-phosphate dehydrogenase [Alkalidesulfovibrio alkalitolerans DSM 16529]|jgi:4-hydroxythreonine-4-phosphate dehydrogenase|uniref:4-hydroxythreonine-4-phosphate dehydrogenase n=1 Tax=Alkalidesulfovibrio alkalitolerans DSM 16529 TaxID=1121439 RepID=S7UL86_9BACT|nr:4-hydroxythreonine-4-phosphate dehydrogenase PdxA [Alkalidesulfovibrio alkalitolerans]EPR34624.1 4-hydroxythreonine-4-phosphate dehydrogenase [Alkalidesulfovibrio alkalitolerans DSM 16529]